MAGIGELLDRAKRAARLETDSQLADAIGVGKAAVSGWRHGARLPDEVACAKLADLTGEPLARVIGQVGEARAISREAKAVWRRLASAAACLVVGVALYAPAPSYAATATVSGAGNIHYAKWRRGKRPSRRRYRSRPAMLRAA